VIYKSRLRLSNGRSKNNQAKKKLKGSSKSILGFFNFFFNQSPADGSLLRTTKPVAVPGRAQLGCSVQHQNSYTDTEGTKKPVRLSDSVTITLT